MVAIAAAVGYSPVDFLHVQVVLGDIADYGALNDWWGAQFAEPASAPARLTYGARLPFGAKVEFQAVASREPLTPIRQPTAQGKPGHGAAGS